jgi:hypothetical protein
MFKGHADTGCEPELMKLRALVKKADKVVREVRHVRMNGGNMESAHLAAESYRKLRGDDYGR